MQLRTFAMSPKTVLRALITAALLASWPVVECQAQVRRYQPSSPTVSPYLNLTRPNDFGGLPNYYSLVRPQLQQQAFNQQAMAVRRQYAGSLQRLTNEVQQGLQPAAPTGTGSWFMVPSAQTSYLNSSRYYLSSPAGMGGGSGFGAVAPSTARPAVRSPLRRNY